MTSARDEAQTHISLAAGYFLSARRLCRAQARAEGTCGGARVGVAIFPDGADRLEAALGRRLDRLNRQMERLERHAAITNEMLALFIRFWLTHTPPLSDTALPAAQAKGSDRFEGFVEALGRRLTRGNTFADDLTREVEAAKRAQSGTEPDDP